MGGVAQTRGDLERLAAVRAASVAGASGREAWGEWGGVVVDDEGLPTWDEPTRLHRELTAAALVAARHGVPLGALLGELAAVESVREEQEAAAQVALAGPRASARVLLWLPPAGLALAWLIEPAVARVLATGFGAILLGLGAGLMAAGSRWMAALQRRAAAARELP